MQICWAAGFGYDVNTEEMYVNVTVLMNLLMRLKVSRSIKVTEETLTQTVEALRH